MRSTLLALQDLMDQIAIDETLAILGPKAREKIHLMGVPEMRLSATYLRERLRSGKNSSIYVTKMCGGIY